MIDRLTRLLSEAPEAAIERERAEEAKLCGPSAPPLVLRGAGHLGQSVLARLAERGVRVAALADEDPRRQGRRIDDVPIMSSRQALETFGPRARFVVTIYSPGRSVGEVLRELSEFGCRETASFIPILWALGDQGLPHFGLDRPHRVLLRRDEILDAFHVFADDLSREVFTRQIQMRLTGVCGEFDDLVSVSDQYFPAGLLELNRDERILDGGAFDGSTLRMVVSLGTFDRMVCVEPDPISFRRLQKYVSCLPPVIQNRVSTVEAALGARRDTLRFNATGDTGAALAESGALLVRCMTIPEAMDGVVPTYVKLDIEGGEEAALRGAEAMIRNHTPVLAVCVYHRPADLWMLPLQVRSMTPSYRLYLRCHQYDGLDTVLYAIPEHR